jgi:hypothetical protein
MPSANDDKLIPPALTFAIAAIWSCALRLLSNLSAPWANLIGAALIALSIVGAQLLAPYRVGGGTDGTWRLNAITGEMERCIFGIDPPCRARP